MGDEGGYFCFVVHGVVLRYYPSIKEYYYKVIVLHSVNFPYTTEIKTKKSKI